MLDLSGQTVFLGTGEQRTPQRIGNVGVITTVVGGGAADLPARGDGGPADRAYIEEPQRVLRGGKRYRIVADERGSVRLVVDTSSGAVAQRMDYDAWGNVTNDTNPGFQPFGFAGGLYDRDTGFVRFGARDYDPSIGRWLRKEPLRFRAGKNFYIYAFNDPVNLFDPTGRQPTGAGGASGQGEGGSEGTGSGGGYSPTPDRGVR